MKTKYNQLIALIISLVFIYVMMYFTFNNHEIFWYLYTFTLLIGIAISIVFSSFSDELPTWQYLIFGIGYGVILYGIVKLGSLLLSLISKHSSIEISNFLSVYGPQNIWHYLFLVFIIVIGEEMFWRCFVQQKLKKYTTTLWAIFITSLLYSLSLAISGFAAGAIAAFIAGIILGALYEWRKSLPQIIIAHEVFVILLFLVLPLS